MPDLYDIMREWAKGKSEKFVAYESTVGRYGGPGDHSMEVVCAICHTTLGDVNNETYVAYEYLPVDATPNLEVLEFVPADPKFFDKILKSMAQHPCYGKENK